MIRRPPRSTLFPYTPLSRSQGWWTRRICGGLVSYWVYQHLGDLSPQELAENTAWQAVQEDRDDAEPVLQAMAEAADRDPRSVRWSYVRHWGEARMIVIDSRAGRVLDESARGMLDEDEFAWVEADRKSTRLNSSHANISYAVFCLKKKKSSLHTPIVCQLERTM